MTDAVIQSAAEHAMGNLRAMMMIGNELLCQATEDNETQIDENLRIPLKATAHSSPKATSFSV